MDCTDIYTFCIPRSYSDRSIASCSPDSSRIVLASFRPDSFLLAKGGGQLCANDVRHTVTTYVTYVPNQLHFEQVIRFLNMLQKWSTQADAKPTVPGRKKLRKTAKAEELHPHLLDILITGRSIFAFIQDLVHQKRDPRCQSQPAISLLLDLIRN